MGRENLNSIPPEGRRVPPKETLSQIEGDESAEDRVELMDESDESIEEKEEKPRARNRKINRRRPEQSI